MPSRSPSVNAFRNSHHPPGTPPAFPRLALSQRPRFVVVARGVRHPERPVAGDLVKFPDGHFSIRTTFAVTATFHGVSRAFGRRVERAARRKGVAHV